MQADKVFSQYLPRLVPAFFSNNFQEVKKICGEMSSQYMKENNLVSFSNLDIEKVDFILSGLTPTQDAILTFLISIFMQENIKNENHR
jgi:hypothetical protein